MEKYIVDNIKDFNLDHIFDCGQCFRWKKEEDGGYRGRAFGREVKMIFDYNKGSTSQGRLTIENCNKEEFETIWKNYLDLDRDYGEIKDILREKDEVIRKAISKGEGIRILKQDLWETIISFIISQNNNIPRIKSSIENLCNTFGESGDVPKVEVLARLSEEDLQPIKLGYRAKYLIETAKAVQEKGLPQNYDQLLQLTGIGPKVANCISLFALGDMSSFPIDVWVKRVMNKLYNIEENNLKEMKEFASATFGKYGGIAQQYLFYYIRQLDEEKNS